MPNKKELDRTMRAYLARYGGEIVERLGLAVPSEQIEEHGAAISEKVAKRYATIKEWRQNHPEKVREYSREWKKRHPEYGREWWRKNADRMREYKRVYNAEHREENKARLQKWRAEHREEYLAHARAYAAKRRAEQKAAKAACPTGQK